MRVGLDGTEDPREILAGATQLLGCGHTQGPLSMGSAPGRKLWRMWVKSLPVGYGSGAGVKGTGWET